MKIFNYFLFTLIALVLVFSCSKTKDETIVEVIARDFNFIVQDSIPSGWTTFRFNNTGHAEHFFSLNLLPDSITFTDYHNDVAVSFDIVFDSLKAGKSKEEATGMLVNLLPQWFFTSLKHYGGTGIISPGESVIITEKLVPGTYVMECYIKEKGVFHTALGMLRPFVVTEQHSNSIPPKENYNIAISNFKYETSGELTLGENTIAVHFNEHPKFGLGNDVHLIKLDENTNIEDVIYWLDWMNIEGLETPAPVMFLGGVQESQVGSTSYFKVNLEPGKYAWIAESSASKGMFELFTVE